MAIPSEAGYQLHSSVSGTGPLSFGFYYSADEDIRVFVTNPDVDFTASDELSSGSFTVASGTAVDAGFDGGSVTLVSSVTNKDIWVVRDWVRSRSTDLSDASYNASDLNGEFDAIIGMVEDAHRKADSAIQGAPGSSGLGFAYSVTQLNAVLAAYLAGSATLATGVSVATLADLKALTTGSTNLVFVYGHTTSNDGWQGHFYWDSSSTETADDGVIVQASGVSTGRWRRVYDGPVNIMWFHDFTADYSAGLDAALATGRSVYFPSGRTYTIGTGTTCRAFVTDQFLLTDAPGAGRLTEVTLQQTLTFGSTSTQAMECGIGDGFDIVCPTTSTAFDVLYARGFYIGRGRCVEAHTLMELGDASASGPTYRVHMHCETGQRAPYLTVTGASGDFTVGETVTGGTSSATGVVTAWDSGAGELTLSTTSSTSFSVAETITGGTSTETATVSAVYRPGHLVICTNFAGDFLSTDTVEGAYDGAANGLHISSNTYTRVDEIRIQKYWGRFAYGVDATDARLVNAHFEADMEGCTFASIRLYVTTATAKSTSDVGWSNINVNRVKVSTLNTSGSAFYFRSERAGVECENLDVDVLFDEAHVTHGVLVQADVGTISGAKIRASGTITPGASSRYGIYVIEGGSGTITGLDISAQLTQSGATALAGAVNVSGDPTGIVREISTDGTVTADVVFSGTQPVGLRLMHLESGVPAGGQQGSPDFSLVNVPTGAGDSANFIRGQAGGVDHWIAPQDLLLVGVEADFSAAPGASACDLAIKVASSLVKAHTNPNAATQSENYYPSSTVAVAKGEKIEIYLSKTSSFTTANIDVVARLQFINQWNDV